MADSSSLILQQVKTVAAQVIVTANYIASLIATAERIASGVLNVPSSAPASSLVVKSTSCSLYRASATNTTGVQGFLVVLNAISAPAADAAIVPVAVAKLAPYSTAVIEFGSVPALLNSGAVVAVVSGADPYTMKNGDGLLAYLDGQAS